jgi:hypothetical protein
MHFSWLRKAVINLSENQTGLWGKIIIHINT